MARKRLPFARGEETGTTLGSAPSSTPAASCRGRGPGARPPSAAARRVPHPVAAAARPALLLRRRAPPPLAEVRPHPVAAAAPTAAATAARAPAPEPASSARRGAAPILPLAQSLACLEVVQNFIVANTSSLSSSPGLLHPLVFGAEPGTSEQIYQGTAGRPTRHRGSTTAPPGAAP